MIPLVARWRRRRLERGLRWVRDLPDRPTGMAEVRAFAHLIPVGDHDGAILLWGFDFKPGATQLLVVRLTEKEAEAVYAADPYTVGLLEPVRRHLTNNAAILAVKCGTTLHHVPYLIPRRGTEDQFLAELDAAADSSPAFAVVDRRQMVPEAQILVQTLDRNLAFA